MDDDYSKLLAELEGWVEIEGEKLLGVIVLAPEPDHLWVDNVAVDPAARGRGLGTKLLELAFRRAVELELPELRLLTHELMASNLTLYQHLGWSEYEPDDPEATFLTYFRKPVSA